ncbi:hypothetical protein LEP1GSC132_0279 [Leptospira kirschneri str. 200803703]|uniref:LIC10173 family protein n=1 Tax=Leptospira kirschneri TaxID=29507 RepID=UPI0002BFD2E1|nr:hypothetical protein [Leptospira kirschneri]EMO65296.1 hypothetical protein LEP1GSC132_0051 [Leptospira kirschneri str. 200803703]EMO67625.1 hypothetical protein LEP1GSC132_0279 [Leptospira kirschneri str. 200803703]
MRKSHIDYIREMVESIRINGNVVIPSDRFFEYQPPLDGIQEKIPCAILKYSEPTNTLGRKIKYRLERIVRGNSVFLKNAVRHAKQEFKYTVDFWLNEPDADVISSVVNRGILDQCLLFVSLRTWIKSEEQIPILVRLGKTGLVDDPAKETGNYKLYVEIIFKDGLYTIEEEETLAGAELEIEGPIPEGV